MTIFLFSASISGEDEKEEKLSKNYDVYLTNDMLSEMTFFNRFLHYGRNDKGKNSVSRVAYCEKVKNSG